MIELDAPDDAKIISDMHAYLLSYPDLVKSVENSVGDAVEPSGGELDGGVSGGGGGGGQSNGGFGARIATDDDLLLKIARSSQGTTDCVVQTTVADY